MEKVAAFYEKQMSGAEITRMDARGDKMTMLHLVGEGISRLVTITRPKDEDETIIALVKAPESG